MAAFSSVARLLQQDLRQGIDKDGVKEWSLDNNCCFSKANRVSRARVALGFSVNV